MSIQIEKSWLTILENEFEKDHFKKLKSFLKEEKEAKKTIYPRGSEIFNAFNCTPFYSTKVVLLGQDPYHGPNQAHGLCFSVLPNIALPPSLLNIYKELYDDLRITPKNGCLINWAKQGVLLLNSILTVQAGIAGSHSNKGWEELTDQVIKGLHLRSNKIIFLLWGNYAIQKGRLIDPNKHIIFKATHPSPLSAHRGFFGCKHFSKVNHALIKHQFDPINWGLN